MRAGDVVGGLALVGVAVVIGLALIEEPTPAEVVSETTAVYVPPDATTTTTAPPTADSTAPTTEPTSTESAAPTTDEATTTAAPTTAAAAPTTTVRPTTTTAAAAPTTVRPTTTTAAATTTTALGRADIAVRVINASANQGVAGEVTAQLIGAGFAPLEPTDAVATAGWLIVFYAPGQRDAALAVNEIVGTDPSLVLPGPAEDPNWAAFGTDLDVLVLVGG